MSGSALIVSLQPHQPAYQLTLALAYLNLKRPDLAKKSLDEAERLDPQAPEIEALRRRMMT